MPSRIARHVYLFTNHGIINIKNQRWEKDFSPIDDQSHVNILNTHSKSYLRHLVRSNELLGMQICTINNLSFYLSLVKEARKQILADNFVPWKKEKLEIVMRRL